jgi:4-methylaminobutanoate oxidase (formaldehyde-forming)
LFDETSFAKIEVSGPDAADFLEWVCDNRVARRVGAVTYTQALNDRGGIECDFTVTRLGPEVFLIVTGTAFGAHDMAWLRRQARRRRSALRLQDVTGSSVCFALWGPLARRILAGLTPTDLGNVAFPFMTAQDLTVADVPVRAQRVTFVGELGWELYASAEYGAALWAALSEHGRPLGLVLGGYRAIDSMRLEKGYRVWSSDLTAETDPYEAGLEFCVKLDKEFCGRAAVSVTAERGPRRRLRPIVLADPRAVPLGHEPVRIDGVVRGRVTSAGPAYSLAASVAYAYLPGDAGPGTAVDIDLGGRTEPGTVAAEPLYDPSGARIRAAS